MNVKTLKKIMSAKGIRSISELSRFANLHRNSIAPYLNNGREITSEVPYKISKALNIDPRLLLKEKEIEFKDAFNVIPIIKKYSNQISEKHCFFLFGSRACGFAKKYSDYDIAYCGFDGDRGLEIKEDLLQAFDDYPVKIDLLNFDNAPSWFLKECNPEFIFISGSKSFYYQAISRVYETKEQN